MITGRVTGYDPVITRLTGLPALLRPRIAKAVYGFAADVTKLTKEKLSDDVLNVRTGRLRRSITFDGKEDGSQITATVGSNVEYARALELGFKGQVSVRSFVRQQTMAFGRSITPRPVSVRASTRNVDIRARRFLQSSLEETKPTLFERLNAIGVAQ